MAKSVHHEGICLFVKARRTVTLAELAKARTVLALDGVANHPHVGALLRTAAYFGVDGMILPAAQGPLLPPTGFGSPKGRRRAHQALLRRRLATALERDLTLPSSAPRPTPRRTRRSAPGPTPAPSCSAAEPGSGLSEAIRATCTALVAIGAGIPHPVESLNVSVAAGILLAARGVS